MSLAHVHSQLKYEVGDTEAMTAQVKYASHNQLLGENNDWMSMLTVEIIKHPIGAADNFESVIFVSTHVCC